MNVTSYNVTDVGYHYIGLRVLAAAPEAPREEQDAAVARNVAKYASERALRLMLPEPRGNFVSVGDKVLQELAHLDLAELIRKKGYRLTELGTLAVEALNTRKFQPLRRLMARAHLETYENLREVVLHHIRHGPIFSPIVEAARATDPAYLAGLLRPIFGSASPDQMDVIVSELKDEAPKKIEDALRARILDHLFPDTRLSLPLFRAMTDRLVSLRLLNVMREEREGCEFAKSYSPCVAEPLRPWHKPLEFQPDGKAPQQIYISEPTMNDPSTEGQLLAAMDEACAKLAAAAGYYDLPEVRDVVCERLMIPEAAFDEGVNAILDQQPPRLTVGLQYERISGRRKPLVRSRESTQIYNLIRRV